MKCFRSTNKPGSSHQGHEWIQADRKRKSGTRLERKEDTFSPTTRTWLRCAQCWWQTLLSFQTDFLSFFHFSPLTFSGEVPALYGLQRCCYLEAPRSQEEWFCKSISGKPWWKLRKVHLSWAVHVRKIIGEKKLSEILELSQIISRHEGNHKCAHLNQVFWLWKSLLLILILKVTLWLIDFSWIDYSWITI